MGLLSNKWLSSIWKADRHILTAAVCVDGGSNWEVRIGGANSQYIIHSSKGIVHPEWDGGFSLANNIAIIELDEPIEFGGNPNFNSFLAKLYFF